MVSIQIVYRIWLPNKSIDKNTVQYNPMGAVMVRVIVNGDSELFVDYIISRNQDNLSIAASSASEKLVILLREKYE
ncbi:DUF1310 family protein [Streptococcus acidominimus]|uniref:DUF1310 family protein n=1 Tax=Streptococcus acidominimus TaxID=1326 RepID=UPI003BF46683